MTFNDIIDESLFLRALLLLLLLLLYQSCAGTTTILLLGGGGVVVVGIVSTVYSRDVCFQPSGFGHQQLKELGEHH
jgi:hypothetical protein